MDAESRAVLATGNSNEVIEAVVARLTAMPSAEPPLPPPPDEQEEAAPAGAAAAGLRQTATANEASASTPGKGDDGFFEDESPGSLRLRVKNFWITQEKARLQKLAAENGEKRKWKSDGCEEFRNLPEDSPSICLARDRMLTTPRKKAARVNGQFYCPEKLDEQSVLGVLPPPEAPVVDTRRSKIQGKRLLVFARTACWNN